MPTSDPSSLAEQFDRPRPAKVIDLPAAEAATGDDGEPPAAELVAVAGQLLSQLDLIARKFGLRFVVRLEETR